MMRKLSCKHSTPSDRAFTRQRRVAAFTLIEVMMSVGIMTFGALGIMALGHASIGGNSEARQMTTATHVARVWLERLRRDSLLWNVGGNSATAANLTATNYLRYTPINGPSGWMFPQPPAGSRESAAFDWYGTDTSNTVNTSPPFYCVNTQYEWVFPGQAIRVDVRVWWFRRTKRPNASITNRADYPNCGASALTAITNDTKLKMIRMSTVLRWTALQ